MTALSFITGIFQDPPPELIFEISEKGIAYASTRAPGKINFHELPPGVVSASPLQENVLLPDVLAQAVAKVATGSNGNRKRRRAALILPDYCARVAVLDFDSFPEKPEERLALIRFRMKKSVPFDLDSAVMSYWPQTAADGKKHDIVVAVTPLEIVSRYEAPFRAANLHPGLVTISSIASLDLVARNAIQMIAKLNGRVLTVMVVKNGTLKLIRSMELMEMSVTEIAADIYPTSVYIEDNFGARAESLLLCGFGALQFEAANRFKTELGVEVEPVRSPFAPVTDRDAGLLGYLQTKTHGKAA